MSCLLLFFMLLLPSCRHVDSIDAHTQMTSRNQLASVILDTPDPRKNDALYRQRLIIDWSASGIGDNSLAIHVRYLSGEEYKEVRPLHTQCGQECFLVDALDFRTKGGILTYKIDLERNGQVVATCQHKLWKEHVLPAK